MTTSPTPTARRVSRVHRVGAALIGTAIAVFGVLGLFDQLASFTTTGDRVAGLSTNVLLSVISLIVGPALIAAGARSDRLASTVTAAIGVAFVGSGLVHLLILGSSLNILNFQLPNVFFSLVTGLVLLTLGLYGRVSGNLPADSPYRVDGPGEADEPDPRDVELGEAEIAVTQHRATPDQERAVHDDRQRRADEHREQTWQRARADGAVDS